MKLPLALRLYRAVTYALPLAAPMLLRRRLAQGKEDKARVRERMGAPGRQRPDGPLVWLHGASVGEGLSLTPLIAKMRERGLNVLVTTGTKTSAQLLTARLPAGAFHQYAPLDAPQFFRRFHDHWRPDILLVAESELWPNMLIETAMRHVPAALINARMSDRSAARWQKMPAAIEGMLSLLSIVLAQSPDDASKFKMLGARNARNANNLKYDVPALPHDPLQFADLSARIGQRPVWLAASTHEGEERIAMYAHKALTQFWPDLVTIIAPRHPDRGEAIASEARQFGLHAPMRSRGESIGAGDQVYIADTIGEMGLFYRLASAVFVGASMAGAGGGHNPIEVAKLGAPVLHGPLVQNFADVYAALDAQGGAFQANTPEELAQHLALLFRDAALVRKTARAAADVVNRFGGASDAILQAIEPWLASLPREPGSNGLREGG